MHLRHINLFTYDLQITFNISLIDLRHDAVIGIIVFAVIAYQIVGKPSQIFHDDAAFRQLYILPSCINDLVGMPDSHII